MVPRDDVRFAVILTPVLLLLTGFGLYFGLFYLPAPVPNYFPCFMDDAFMHAIWLLVTAFFGALTWKTWRRIL